MAKYSSGAKVLRVLNVRGWPVGVQWNVTYLIISCLVSVDRQAGLLNRRAMKTATHNATQLFNNICSWQISLPLLNLCNRNEDCFLFLMEKYWSECICRDSNPGRSDGNAAWYPYTTDACYFIYPRNFHCNSAPPVEGLGLQFSFLQRQSQTYLPLIFSSNWLRHSHMIRVGPVGESNPNAWWQTFGRRDRRTRVPFNCWLGEQRRVVT